MNFPAHDKQVTVLAVFMKGRGGGCCAPLHKVGVAGVSLGRVQQEL